MITIDEKIFELPFISYDDTKQPVHTIERKQEQKGFPPFFPQIETEEEQDNKKAREATAKIDNEVRWMHWAYDDHLLVYRKTRFHTKCTFQLLHPDQKEPVFEWRLKNSRHCIRMPNDRTLLAYDRQDGYFYEMDLVSGNMRQFDHPSAHRKYRDEKDRNFEYEFGRMFFFKESGTFCIVTHDGQYQKKKKVFAFFRYPLVGDRLEQSELAAFSNDNMLDPFTDFVQKDEKGSIMLFESAKLTSNRYGLRVMDMELRLPKKSMEKEMTDGEYNSRAEIKLGDKFFVEVPEHDDYKDREHQQVVTKPQSSAYDVVFCSDGTFYVVLCDIKKANREEVGRLAAFHYDPVARRETFKMMVEYPECSKDVDMRRIVFRCPTFALVRLCTEFVIPEDPKSLEIKFDATYFAYDLTTHEIIDEWTFTNQIDFDRISSCDDEMVHYVQPKGSEQQLHVRTYTYWYYQLKEISLHFLLAMSNDWEEEMLEDILDQLDYPERPLEDQ